MATIFQKIFLPKNEIELINEINMAEIEHMQIYDDARMFTSEHYFIRKKRIEIDTTHDWHHAQGDNYRLSVKQNGNTVDIKSQKIAKRMFIRMQNAYRKQKEF